MSILPQVRPENSVALRCDKPNDARRIVKRALRREWWCIVFTHDGHPHVALSNLIDLKSDLRDRLPNVNFEVVR